MPMTENELADLERYLQRVEKIAKTWRYNRWIAVGAAFFTLAMAAWVMMLHARAYKDFVLRDFGKVPDAVEFRLTMQAAMAINSLYVFAFAFGLLGAVGLASSLCRWNKERNDLLLVKMSRAWVESQQAVPPSAP